MRSSKQIHPAAFSDRWPRLREYDQEHLARIALPLGGIGTGTISLGGRGDLRDWEIVNRPAKGFIPTGGCTREPFFALYAKAGDKNAVSRLLEGPVELDEYESYTGVSAANHGLPRFRHCRFAAAYPFGQVSLRDPDVPLDVRLEAFNPLVPPDADASGIPVAVLRYVLTNRDTVPVTAAVCGTMPNFIGNDGREAWRENRARENRNAYRSARGVRGLFMTSEGIDSSAAQWGTLALATTATKGVSWRTTWCGKHWGAEMLQFWDDFSADGRLTEREPLAPSQAPMGSMAVRLRVPPNASRTVTFLITWHFPNRMAWAPGPGVSACEPTERVGNYYCTQYTDAWDVAARTVTGLRGLERDSLAFVSTFCDSDLPAEIQEAALFNLANLRSQTCFRTEDGHFFGFEGCYDHGGCCWGSCTHVWNYEQATPFLFGALARDMRRTEFLHATDDDGLINFRVMLPLSKAADLGRAAADGQMGCLVKLYRDWQLSGDDTLLRALWPQARRALEFCWVPGGWDADRDGVMEGCQHNTMDVEYCGPNPQMQGWYLGALRACEEIARYLGDTAFETDCRRLFEAGSRWMDTHLFNGEYYEQQVRPISQSDVAKGLLPEAGVRDPATPIFQLDKGCLVDQLVGQTVAHICGLGYLHDLRYIRKTLSSILRYNRRKGFHDHFNCMRSYAAGDETGLLMADYPHGRPPIPFPYFTEVMTGFEYIVAAGLIYEDRTTAGLRVIRDIRDRFDGRKRSPFNETECGHHYARAMASWSAVLAYTGFQYSALTAAIQFAARPGRWFWSTGEAWGRFTIETDARGSQVKLEVLGGKLPLKHVRVIKWGTLDLGRRRCLRRGNSVHGVLKEHRR